MTEQPELHARYFVAPDGGNDLTLWREVPGHPERPAPVLRLCDVSEEAFNIAAKLATNEQPEAQVAGDLIRAEAAIARVRALHAPARFYVYKDDGRRACGECGDGTVLYPCPTIRALDGDDTAGDPS